MRRFTRLTNGFSKKIENLAHAVSLHFMHYNFCRPHMTLTATNGTPTTPAMAAGIADHVWSVEEVCELLQAIRAAVNAVAVFTFLLLLVAALFVFGVIDLSVKVAGS